MNRSTSDLLCANSGRRQVEPRPDTCWQLRVNESRAGGDRHRLRMQWRQRYGRRLLARDRKDKPYPFGEAVVQLSQSVAGRGLSIIDIWSRLLVLQTSLAA